MKNIRKRFFVLAVLVLLGTIVGQQTLAYFTAEETARNVIISGGVGIVIDEYQEVDGELTAYPDEPIKVMPATTVSKVVKMHSEGNDAYVRARYEVIVKNAQGEVVPTPDTIVVKVNGEAWEMKEEGDPWYYAEDVLKAGEESEFFMDSVEFKPELDNNYQNHTIEVMIYAQAVQAANNGDSAKDAAGWPEEIAE